MAMGKNKYRVLVAGGNDKVCESISELLPKSDYESVLRAVTAGETRRMLLDTDVDIVILNAPLKDEFGTQLAIDLSEDNVSVLLLVPGDVYEQVAYRVEDYGVVTLQKPMSRQSLYSAIKILTALRAKLLRMDRKNQALQEKMMDIRFVNRAKWLLIEHANMTESDAHYYIEKQAMDRRLSRREVAQSIIRTYDMQEAGKPE